MVDDIAGQYDRLAPNGAHLPSLLASILQQAPDDATRATILRGIARHLEQLTGDVRAIGLDQDELRNVQSLFIEDFQGRKLMPRAISDGTLRFLALAMLSQDIRPALYCIEEPENGLHPTRIAKLIDMLLAISVDRHFPIEQSNPLRQIIVTTHSPIVVSHVPDDSLIYVESLRRKMMTGSGTARYISIPAFRWLKGTWRSRLAPEPRKAVARAHLFSYVAPPTNGNSTYRSVLDNPEIQAMLGNAGESNQ